MLPLAAVLAAAIPAALAAWLGLAYARTFAPTPEADAAAVAAEGGLLVPLADGRVAEVFQYGATGDDAAVMVYFPGYTLSGSAAGSWDDVCRARGVRLLGISMAGWGASSPQRGRAYADAGRDALAVVAHLGLGGRPLHVVGVSFGAGNAAAMAALLPPARVASLSLIIPSWPSMGGHDTWRGTGLVMRMTGMPFLDRLWQFYVAPRLDIPSLLKSLAPRDWAEFEAKMPGAVAGMTRELKRSTRYHTEGACDGMRLLREGGRALAAARADLAALGPRVAVWWARDDQLAPAHHGEFLAAWLPAARAFPQPGGHLGMFTRLEPFLDAALGAGGTAGAGGGGGGAAGAGGGGGGAAGAGGGGGGPAGEE